MINVNKKGYTFENETANKFKAAGINFYFKI